MSETTKIRNEVLPYCKGNGVDLGYGWDKINKTAISVDKGERGFDDLNYDGDARDLPFKNETMDYVYSSHLLEDFVNTKEILIEWIRILKIGGYLILYLPIQKKYVEHCTVNKLGINTDHKVDMSLDYLLNCVVGLPLELIESINPHADYSFLAIFRKI